MTPEAAPDPLLRMLARLPAALPDAVREQRVRARCHAALAQSRQRRHRAGNVPVSLLLKLAFTIAASLYVSEAVRAAWRLNPFR